MKKKICLSAMICGVFSLYATDLVKDGQPGAVIAIPTKPSIWTQRAAADLQYHVEKASGAKLKILSPEATAKSTLDKVYIDKNDGFDLNALGRNDFYIKNIGRNLVISGKGEGASQGVRYLLETKMNVRWIWPGELGEVIPKAKTISINGMDLKFKQPITSSRIHPSNTGRAGWQSKKAWKAFNAADAKWLARQGFSWDSAVRSQHSFTHPGWKYQKKYLKSHPEYFHMLPDGTRRPNPYHVGGSPGFIGICPSSKTLLAQVLKDWKGKRAKGYPFGPNLYLGESDARGSCCCEACLKADHSSNPNRLARAKAAFKAGKKNWTNELGDVTERYMEFYLKALNEAKKIDPNVKVVGWAAYANYAGPPKYNKLNKDIVVAFVGYIMYPWTSKKIDEFTKSWKGWRDAGATMVLRPNFMLDGHNMPVNFARKFHALYQMCLANNMIGTEFDSDIGQFGGNGFNYYVMARMIRNPELSYDDILNEYCDAFGSAAPDIKDYLNYWEKISDSKETFEAEKKAVFSPVGVEVGSWNYFYMKAPLVYTPRVMAKGRSFLNRAAAKVKNDLIARKRVKFLQKGLKHAELTLEAQRAYDSKDKLKLALAVQRLDKYRAKIEPDFVSNMFFLTHWENVCWDRASLKFMLNAPGIPLTQGWKFMFDPNRKGKSRNFAADNFDTSKWYDIGVEKGWEKYPVGKEWKRKHKGQDYDGIGWYRNSFKLDPTNKGGNVTLTFGAVDEACTVYVNGKKVLERPYPYKGNHDSWMTPFTVDVTKAIRFDKANTITVRVVDTAGQGGIWKPVWFKTTVVSSNHNPNLVKNPGFEEKKNAVGEWPAHAPNGKHKNKFDKNIARTGKVSYKIECVKTNPNFSNLFKKAWMRIYQAVAVKPNKTYFFRVWYRTNPGYNGSVRIWVLGKGIKYMKNVGDTNGLWQEVSFPDCKMGSETTSATIYLNTLGAVGRVWFDDVELRLK